MSTATCALCGVEGASSAMDMTGHGWRCIACAARAELAKSKGSGAEMAEHLNPGELHEIVASGGNEAWGGAGLALLGTLATAASFSAGGRVVIICTGMLVSGLGMLGHGLHRRKMATAALRQFPTARTI